MTKCNTQLDIFPRAANRKVQVNFNGGCVSSDGGILLVQQADRYLNLISSVAKQIQDPRLKSRCTHSIESMLIQRVYGLCQGYEDLNDHDQLRHDIGFQSAAKRNDE